MTMVADIVACERRRISGRRLSPPKITSANPNQETISVTYWLLFLFGQSDFMIEWNSSAPRSEYLAQLFWGYLS